ncbi:DUF6691 family protein [Phaeobacter sp. HF9A]|uniref:DUF6691 family protein n=1 Tax=Phaeobacter sp. HF9A TaxID=2721561 RepID=UPI001430B0CE|nr:DUF6691 family protein [Phaeobacter sp. HF9A]NIZ15122.1 hypothetical protein [Phaeobacter sp. HF9A]
MRSLLSLLSGSLFGVGLLLSGMTDTTKVQGWLDLFGAWDPTLAFVMGGALIPMAIAWRLTRNRHPLAGGTFPAPPTAELDRRLIIGSVLFGFGWALAGLCPGPALASLSFGGWQGVTFVAAMLLGMLVAPKLRLVLDQTAAKS